MRSSKSHIRWVHTYEDLVFKRLRVRIKQLEHELKLAKQHKEQRND